MGRLERPAVVILLALALLAARPQDTLRLGPGIHPGPLVLTRPTVVLGAPGAILTGAGRGTVLVVQARGSVVRGLTIEGSGRDPDHYDAGVRVAADSVTLEDLTIRDVLFGVYVEQARDGVLRRIAISGSPTEREGDRGDGISFYASRAMLAEQNRITGTRDGIYFSYSDSVVVRDNHVSHVRFGLHYMFSHVNRFEGNVFTDNAAGAVIMNSRNVTVTGNVFAWNAGSRSYGLVLQTATDPVISGNSFVGNGIGVFFDNVIHGEFTGNLIGSNWLGLELFANSEGTVVTGNAVVGNTFDVSGGGAPGAYTLCRAGQGNYWSKAARDGYDLDGDGTLDAPHAASSPLAELALTHDNLRPLLDSPAARALEWAERTFPAFATAGAVDSCPRAHPPRLAALADLPPAPAARLGGMAGAGGRRWCSPLGCRRGAGIRRPASPGWGDPGMIARRVGIELAGVTKRFGARTAVAPLTLTVSPGEVVALVGPNGAGKSTTLRILAGAIHASAGVARIAGWDVALEPLKARLHLGYLPQRFGVPLTTVVGDLADLVAAARGLPAGAGVQSLAEVGLADRLGATLGEMSGGQRQRVMLALVTLGSIDALILDEPSISLDAEGAEEVREAIRAARRAGAAVLFASHHLSDVARLADRIAVMVEGRVVAFGTVEELAVAAGVAWDQRIREAPIERIYRILVGGRPEPRGEPRLKIVGGATVTPAAR